MKNSYIKKRHRLAFAQGAHNVLKICAPEGPPFDPFVIARKLGVEVRFVELDGVEGYVQEHKGKSVVVISSRSPGVRRRFTMAHELCHILIMRSAFPACLPTDLIRYRAPGCPPGLEQDPVEEALCNWFAAELLMPTCFVRESLQGVNIGPRAILDLAKEFQVSVQAAATKIVGIIGRRFNGFSLWNFRTSLPVPRWWVGLRPANRLHVRDFEHLASRSVNSGRLETQKRIFISHGRPVRGEAMPFGESYSLMFATAVKRVSAHESRHGRSISAQPRENLALASQLALPLE